MAGSGSAIMSERNPGAFGLVSVNVVSSSCFQISHKILPKLVTIRYRNTKALYSKSIGNTVKVCVLTFSASVFMAILPTVGFLHVKRRRQAVGNSGDHYFRPAYKRSFMKTSVLSSYL